jgi:hypothetical protein
MEWNTPIEEYFLWRQSACAYVDKGIEVFRKPLIDVVLSGEE